MDQTALQRQHRRIEKLRTHGVTRSTVLVHDECKPALNTLRPHLVDPLKAKALADLIEGLRERKSPTNVAQVKQLSPFRYPGGKTWLVPEVRKWLLSTNTKHPIFVEPFAGGAMAGLTIAAEGLADHVYLCELDDDVAAVWQTIFEGSELDVNWLCKRIVDFQVTLDNVKDVLSGEPSNTKTKAFRTIVKNRMQRGGIMAPGAGLVKAGENGRGLMSRWYPATLANRIQTLRLIRDRVTFAQCDAFDFIEPFSCNPDVFFFVDPPYTAGGKSAGSRLYTHSTLDHSRLFQEMAATDGSVMLTYDDALEVRELAAQYGFRVEEVPMKNTHHTVIRELLVLKP